MGKQMVKEQRLGLMGNSMKGNGKIGNDVTGRNTTNAGNNWKVCKWEIQNK